VHERSRGLSVRIAIGATSTPFQRVRDITEASCAKTVRGRMCVEYSAVREDRL